MHPGVAHLIELQSVDLRLSDVHARLATFPKRLAELDARVETARAQLAAAKTSHTGSLKERKTFEMDVDQWKEKVRKYKDQTAAVKTNEAYKALLHEIELAEAEVAKAEDRLLDRMVAGEEFERQIKAAEKSLAEAEAVGKAERQTIDSQKSVTEKDLAELEAERARATAEIPEDLLDVYHRIAKKHNGVGLAEVREEMCLKCGVRVRPHVFQELRSPANHEIFRCESCTRILYYVEAAAGQAPAPAASQAVAQGNES